MSGSFEFLAPKPSARWYRDIYLSEKIDGTNAAIQFDDEGNWAAQSKKRLITPESDNFGFAGWVDRNSFLLFNILGPGVHRGEWWGKGIQRGYGLEKKRFSLFNTARWTEEFEGYEQFFPVDDQADIAVVPELYRGTNSEIDIQHAMWDLQVNGSRAVPGWMKPEGIVIYHRVVDQVFKVTFDGNDKGKWELSE